MTMIYVDRKEYEVNRTDNLLKACLSLGLDIPYFCWHPALGSVGACRQCAVKQYINKESTHGSLVMSCMTPVTEGISVSINDSEAKQFRKSVIEWLMINHPHDCPVCEEGGNCHLQDITVMTGHNFRRYRFTKRTYLNQDLGPFISHEMNRCISCYRCVRYYRDYADGQDLGVYGIHDNIYFGRLKDGSLESEFSGNLVEICPTGVFTDKVYSENYTRKWDMQFAPSICQQCSIGCNISPGERYGKLCRVENRYNGTVNHYFLCDRGRFGHGYVNLEDRPRHPIQRCDNNITSLSIKQAVQSATNIIFRSKKVIGIGSSRASIESNFALRELVGIENFYSDISQNEQECLKLMLKMLQEGGIYTPTLREIESYDAILVLGEDVTQTGARVALAIRQAIKSKAHEVARAQEVADWQISAVMNIGQNAKYPLFITSVDKTHLDDIATWTYYAPIEDQARFGFAVAHALDNKAPAVKGLDRSLKNKANIVAQALASAKKPLIISGTNSGSVEILKAAVNVSKALKNCNKDVGITMVARAVNSIGLGMIGSGSLEEALGKLESGEADSVVVLESDLYYHASAARVNMAIEKATLIVIDHQYTMIMNRAHLSLSAASFAESNGTVINNEGRAQRFFQVYDPTYYDSSTIMLESWRWLHLLYSAIKNCSVNWTKLDHVVSAIAENLPHLARIKNVSPDASFRIHGQKLAREPHCYSGRTAIRANISVHEPRQPSDNDTMFSFSMEGNNQPFTPRSEIPFAWVPGWNSPQAWNKFQNEIGGNLRFGDPGIRLIEVSENSFDYFISVPDSFQVREGNWRIAPYYYLFGSDELSQRSSVFRSRIPKLYIRLNPIDAEKLGVNASMGVSFSYEGQNIILPLKLSKRLMAGQVGLPIGILGITPMMVGAYLNNLQGVKI